MLIIILALRSRRSLQLCNLPASPPQILLVPLVNRRDNQLCNPPNLPPANLRVAPLNFLLRNLLDNLV